MVWTFDLEPELFLPRGQRSNVIVRGQPTQVQLNIYIYRNFLHAEIRIELIQHSLISHHYGKLVFIDLCMYSTNQNFIASLHMVFYI